MFYFHFLLCFSDGNAPPYKWIHHSECFSPEQTYSGPKRKRCNKIDFFILPILCDGVPFLQIVILFQNVLIAFDSPCFDFSDVNRFFLILITHIIVLDYVKLELKKEIGTAKIIGICMYFKQFNIAGQK